MHFRRLVLLGTVISSLLLAAPVGAGTTPSTYVALGDSYTSGAGLGPFLAGSNGCDRSPDAYPEVVARALVGTKLAFVACSGATIAQITTQVAKARAALSEASLVTLTAGGNDLSFSKVWISCVGVVTSPSSNAVEYLPVSGGPSACTSAVTRAAKLLGARVNVRTGAVIAPSSVTATTLSTTSPIESRLLTLVQASLGASASGNAGAGANVLVVAYPMLLAHRTPRVCRISASPLDLPAGAKLYPVFSSLATRELIAINVLLRRETAAVVRTLEATSPRLALVNTPSFAPIDCRTGASNDLNGLSVALLRSGGSFHPTAVGQTLLATAVLGRIS